jgi:type I restriction enzyme, S subunit
VSGSEYPLLLLKRVATINDDALGENTDADFELQYIDIGNVDSNGEIHEIATYRFENAPSRARRIVRDGDVIISTVRTYLQAITQINNPPDNLIVSTGFAVVRPKPGILDTGYCKYALREPFFLHEVVGRSAGVSYPAITSTDLADIPIYLPSIIQQRTISEYLDRETAHIDSMIAAKERLLELLAEKRRAIITHAVTRGLNPDVSMRDSGVQWLGKIPASWKVAKLSRVVGLQNIRTDGNSSNPNYVGLENIEPWTGKRLSTDKPLFLDDIDKKGTSNLFLPGDVLFGKLRPYLAKAHLASQSGICTTEFLIMKPKEHILGEFLLWVILTPLFIDLVNSYTFGSKMPRAEWDTVGEITIPLPDVDEQLAIRTYIKNAVGKIDKLVSIASSTISLLHERRTALIAAVVSGQNEVAG